MTETEATNVRTPDDKVLQGPITVVLAGVERVIPLLPYIEAKEFRKKYVALLKGVAPLAAKDAENQADIAEMLTKIGEELPDECVDMFFEYAKALDRTEIEATATEPELMAAIEEVFKVANPLSWQAMFMG